MRFGPRVLAFTILADEIFATKAVAPDSPQKRRRLTLGLADGARVQLDFEPDVAQQIVAAGGGTLHLGIECPDAAREDAGASEEAAGEQNERPVDQGDQQPPDDGDKG